jgi:hypothetical protein
MEDPELAGELFQYFLKGLRITILNDKKFLVIQDKEYVKQWEKQIHLQKCSQEDRDSIHYGQIKQK